MRRWRDGRHEEWWRKDIEARVFWNWVRADRKMTRDGYGVRARAERAISFEQLAWRETAWKEMEGGRERGFWVSEDAGRCMRGENENNNSNSSRLCWGS